MNTWGRKGQPVPGNRISHNVAYYIICILPRSAHIRIPSIDLYGFDFVCCRGGFRVPDQVIYSSIGTSVSNNTTGTGKTATAVGVTTTVTAADRRRTGPRLLEEDDHRVTTIATATTTTITTSATATTMAYRDFVVVVAGDLQ